MKSTCFFTIIVINFRGGLRIPKIILLIFRTTHFSYLAKKKKKQLILVKTCSVHSAKGTLQIDRMIFDL